MNNQEKNTYVKKAISDAVIKILKEKSLNDISISEICNVAGVGRASFYRNYQNKEDILKQYNLKLIKEWGERFENDPKSSIHNVFGSLFQHYKDNTDFYMLLYKNDLTYIILNTIKEISGPKPDMNNKDAYGKAFISYGIYGWVVEWMSRGMKDSAEDINEMLSSNT